MHRLRQLLHSLMTGSLLSHAFKEKAKKSGWVSLNSKRYGLWGCESAMRPHWYSVCTSSAKRVFVVFILYFTHHISPCSSWLSEKLILDPPSGKIDILPLSHQSIDNLQLYIRDFSDDYLRTHLSPSKSLKMSLLFQYQIYLSSIGRLASKDTSEWVRVRVQESPM